MAPVNIQNVQKRFGAVNVIHGIDIDIGDGEFVVLVGPSGCGKSTLLRMIAGLEEVSDGEIHIGAREVSNLPARDRDIAMVFQNYALYPHMTVKENMGFALKLKKVSADETAAKVNKAAGILGLDKLLDRYPRQLSGGQRQRVAMGRALVRDPQVFLFDEPLSNLDAKLRSELRVEIKRLHQSLKNTMIYVTHDQIEALTLADRIAIMKSGVIQQLDDPISIYNRPRNLFVAGFIGSPSMNFLRGELAEKNGKVEFVANGVSFTLDGYDASTPLTAGTPAVLGVRPEHVRVDNDITGGDIHDAVVDIEEPMGADNLIWLKLAGHTLSVRVGGHRRFAPGTKVKLAFDMSMASLFDATTEERI